MYSPQACFLGALQLVASKSSSPSASLAKDAKVHTKVHLGSPNEKPGFGLAVEITVEGISDEALVKAAHEVSSKVPPLPLFSMQTQLLVE